MSAITPVLQSILTQIVIIILGILGAAALYYIKLGADYLKSKIGTDNYAKAKSLIATLVHAYEQNPAFASFDGAAKKEAVLAQITQYCETNKIPVTHQMLDMWLEEAVHVMNSDILEIMSNPISVPPTGNTAPSVG